MSIVEWPKSFCASFKLPVCALMKLAAECLKAWKAEAPEQRDYIEVAPTEFWSLKHLVITDKSKAKKKGDKKKVSALPPATTD